MSVLMLVMAENYQTVTSTATVTSTKTATTTVVQPETVLRGLCILTINGDEYRLELTITGH
jgi:hypothetical protein